MSRIKIGQIGVSHSHAPGKIKTLRAMPDVFEIVGVVDDRDTSPNRDEGDDLAPYQGLRFMTRDELLDTPGLQAVVIETGVETLVPTALQCVQRNLPMHLDKPGGSDMPLFQQLLDQCKTRDLPLQMGYMFRANPAMQWCINAVRNGWLGDIFEISASMGHNYGGEKYPRYIANYPGGIMYILGCHLIDLTIAMLGRPQHVTPFLKDAPGDPPHSNSNCQVVLQYPHAIATLHACSRQTNGIAKRYLRVCGTNGTFELSPLERFDGLPLQAQLTLRHAAGPHSQGTHTLDFGSIHDRYHAQLLELANIIQGKQPNPRLYEHDALVQQVTLAACNVTHWPF